MDRAHESLDRLLLGMIDAEDQAYEDDLRLTLLQAGMADSAAVAAAWAAEAFAAQLITRSDDDTLHVTEAGCEKLSPRPPGDDLDLFRELGGS